MDKNKIKSFAIWARRSLIKSVSEKAYSIGIYEDKVLEATAVQGGFKLEGKEEILTLSKKDRDALVKQVNEKGFEQVMEEVAYTWFNRFMGLRYMEVNDYLPTGVRIFSSEVKEKKEPDVLTKISEVIDELSLNANEIYDLLDTGNTLDREKAYRIILFKKCNELGKIIPQMFEKISDYTELLLPDNLLEEGSVIRRMVEDIEESDWREEVEIIGWMYQYYISEKKDEVFAALKKNVKITKENIPAATQLFTPKWIVKYMVENSLGRLWLEGHPNEELQKEFKYYLEEAEQEPEVEEELKKIREEHAKLKPEDIKVLDPCMGSGHILVYAFDVLYETYKTAGYSEREIPRMILQNNLYGLDIDDRAAQLASFALIMKARHYNRRLFREMEREGLELNLCSIYESNELSKEVIDYFVGENEDLRKHFEYLVKVFTDAKEYGSILEIEKVNFKILEQRLEEIYEFKVNNNHQINSFENEYRQIILDILPNIIKQAKIISFKYNICITNPPYMGRKSMTANLAKYLDENYQNTKSDMYSTFISRCYKFSVKDGFIAFITPQSFMFLSSFTGLRDHMYTESYICNMTHLGFGTFGADFGTTATVLKKSSNQNYKAIYIRLCDYKNVDEKNKQYFNNLNRYIMAINELVKIPEMPIAYWISNNMMKNFGHKYLYDYSKCCKGLDTGNNEKFLRLWHEVNCENTSINNSNVKFDGHRKWCPYNKGGSLNRWYGNNEYLVNWESNGNILTSYPKSNIRNRSVHFKQGITWTTTSSAFFTARFSKNGFLFDSKGSMCFPHKDENIYYLLGALNSKPVYEFLKIITPTVDYNPGPVSRVPIVEYDNKVMIENLVKECIEISTYSWDSFETSWDFKVHPLLKFLDKAKDFKLSSSFEVWESECEANFNQLKANEEELNRIFIDIYGLQDELTPEVDDKDVTIRKADRERDIKSFISYAVGCMVGRYSADVSFVVEKKDDGYYGVHSDNIDTLIYAGGDFNDKWNLEEDKVRRIERDEKGIIISDSWTDSHFLPDADNIIPITEDEYFEDDIVSRFIDFVKLYFGAKDLEGNLDFIADSIGRKPSETARQAIRRYFIKDFYKDHLKVYQKRPIYWMFESGKNDGFRCLIYMHRYNEQTVAKVRTDYLHTLQRKYEAEINRLQLVVDSEKYTAKDRTAAKKKIDRISKQIEECREYDQVVAHLANEKISIDLDDGVKVNYAKFQGVNVINSKGKETKMNLLAKI